MGFRGAGCAAAAVTPCSATQQNNDIAVNRAFSAYIFRRCCRDYCADFHSLCHIAFVIEFIYLSCCQTNLVAVGAIACCRCGNNLSLGQLAAQCFGNGCQGVACTCHTHCGIYIGTTAQRVTNGTAYTGSRAAKGFDFCGMVMGFIFKQQQPFFCFAFYVYINFHSAGIDFLGFIQLIQLAFLFQEFCYNRTHIHQIDGLCSADGFSGCQIFVICRLQGRILKFDAVDGCLESSMAAVVRPIGINHLDFRNGRVSLLAQEILLADLDIIQIHCQTHILDISR